MRRFLAFLAVLSLALSAPAQYNEIKNLSFSQWYDYPYNFFTLNWDAPSPGNDTLMGYAIYRNNELYRIQADNFLYHLPTSSNSSDTFLSFNNSSFYIHVTAIYNHDSMESVYVDSTLCYGLALSVALEPNIENPSIQSAICQSTISILNNQVCDYKIIDLNGRTIMKGATQQSKLAELNISKLSPGYYILVLKLTKKPLSFKIIKI